MKFVTDMLTSRGGRPQNEDRCNFLSMGPASCWILADGLGGHSGGEVAADTAVDAVMETFSRLPALDPAVLRECLIAADLAIRNKKAADPMLARMGSTAVMLVGDGQNMLWAHVGDSRLYHFRGGKVRFQTKDHSVAQALVDTGEIDPTEIRFHEDRSSLRRSLGKHDGAEPAIADAPLAVEPGDAFLLCSDGLWEHVRELEMEIELAKSATPGEWLQGMERRLRHHATGEFDNYSGVAVLVEE